MVNVYIQRFYTQNKRCLFIWIAFLSFVFAGNLNAQTRYVRQGASGTGTSWANASGDLQLMINQAGANSEIWVAQGTYKPNRPANNLTTIDANNRNNAFVLKADVKIYGGFASTGTPTMAQRNWTTYPTILSGDIGTLNDTTDNAYHVVVSSGPVGSAELNGFTVTRGNANLNTTLSINGNDVSSNYGGGMCNFNASPTIVNCTFLRNASILYGGGMCNYYSFLIVGINSSPIVTNCVFSENTAGNISIGGGLGGGMCNFSCTPILTNCNFSGNYSSYFGGGMCNLNSSSVLTDCVFSGNNSSYQGGGLYNSSSSPILTNCVFSGNNSTQYGGGLYNTNTTSSPTISGSTFQKNTASAGGGMYNNNSGSLNISSSSFQENTAYNGGGMYNYNTGSLNISNSTFQENTVSSVGGGIYTNNATQLNISNCTFKENTASYYGGGLFTQVTLFTIVNSLIVNNTGSEGSGIYNFGGAGVLTNVTVTGNSTYGGMTWRNSIHKGTVEGTGINTAYNSIIVGNNSTANGNLLGTTDPLFVNPATGDYRLQSCSPAINSGDNTYIPSGVTTDLLGNTRIYETTVDMGDYELQSPKPIPNISTEPVNAFVCTGVATSFGLTATNATIYQWQVNTGSGFANISNTAPYSGATAATLNISSATAAMNGYTYRCIVSGICQPIDTSATVTLSVGNTRYVRQGGSGNGSSWANASGDLQLMINQTCANSEIWVAQGTYKPNRPANNLSTIDTTNRDNAFVLKANVKIYGGFASTGTPTMAQRNWTTYPTILSGDIGTLNDTTDNAYHVVVSSAAVGTAELNGFTITRGNANLNTTLSINGNNINRSYGGGMYNSSSSPIVLNCTFSQNTCSNFGGGLFNLNSSATVTNSTFSGNQAYRGGGMYNSSSSPTISNSNFSGNRANSGGGMINYNSSSPNLTDCNFSGNSANNGGGMVNEVSSSPQMTNCNFSENTAVSSAGGMYNNSSIPILNNCTFSENSAIFGGGIYNSNSSYNLTECNFSENVATYGGGMCNSSSSPSLTDCIFSGNRATNYGGGMYNASSSNPTITTSNFLSNTANFFGGGIYNTSSSPNLTGCAFSGNTATSGNGGGMYNSSSSPAVTECSFSGNTALSDGGGMYNLSSSSPTLNKCIFSGNDAGSGGGLYNYISSPTVINSLFTNNTAPNGSAIYNESGNGLFVNVTVAGNSTNPFREGGSTSWKNSIIKGNVTGTGYTANNSIIQGNNSTANGNLPGSTDPLFVNPATGDYRLQSCSPAINAGNNTHIPSGIVTDIAGNIRIYETTVDIGAYEYQSPKPAPVITVEPLNTVVCTGGSASFSITVMNAGTYQWQVNTGSGFANISNTAPYSGATTATLNISNITAAMNGYAFRCIAIGCTSNDTSATVTLSTGNIRYVRQGGTGNGSSWANASGDLQLMINQACANSEIWVAQGTYKPYNPADSNNINNTFSLKADVKIFGGFAPTGTPTMVQRNWTTYPAILSGDIGIIGNSADNCKHVVVSNGAVGTAELNGFTITAGNEGGVYNYTSSPTLTNCTFSGNNGIIGGGMYNYYSSPTLANCTFSANTTTYYGGGIYNYTSSPILTNCSFSGNTTILFGGGIYNEYSSPNLTNCTFSGNTSSVYSGGLYNTNNSSPILTNCTFSGNTAGQGGGMYNTNSSSPIVTNCLLTNNSASVGSAIYNDSGNGVFTNVTIAGNSTNTFYAYGVTHWKNSIIKGTVTGTIYNMSNSIIEGNSIILNGNLAGSTDPLFVNPAAGDYRLQPCSPAVNAGNNTDIPSGIVTDLDGSVRINETTVDMGAYELQLPKQYVSQITTEPVSMMVCTGNASSFSIATSNPTTYQWQVNTGSGFANISNTAPYSGATTATLNISNATTAMNGYTFRCIIMGCLPNDTSATATLGVGNIRYVRQGGTGLGNSWANANGDLQLMINQACPNTEIWVAQGTYKPNRPSDNLNTINTNNRGNAFVLKADVKIYGGYAPTGAPDMAQRNWTAYPVILSGDIGIPNNNTDNAYHVVASSGAVGTAELNGFTITASSDGGMYNNSSSPAVTNCLFSGNNAGSGGGMMNDNASSPVVTNCTFSGNTASSNGGGMYNNTSSPTLTNCSFSGNNAINIGGGIYNNSSSPTLTNCSFSGNTALSGGGISNNSSSFNASNCNFSGNTATNIGGGMQNSLSSPNLTNCTFSENTASSGGGMHNYFSFSTSGTLNNCIFSENTATNLGGGMFNYLSSPNLTNSTFSENTATNSGGGIYNNFSSPNLINSLLVQNTSPSGSAIYSQTGNGSFINVTVAGNSVNSFYASEWTSWRNSILKGSVSNVSNIVSRNSIIEGANNTSNGNLPGNTDPLFVNPTAGNYRLQACSPAINAGLNIDVPSGITTDVAGNPRIQQNIADIGAYENQGYSIQSLANTALSASGSCQTADGWIHFYNDNNENKIFVSVHTHGQNLGQISASTILNANYGVSTQKLTIPYGLTKNFFPFNRSWNLESTNAFANPVSVRFYFNSTDSSDIASLFTIDSLYKLTLYKVNGNNVWNTAASGYKEYFYGSTSDTSHYIFGEYQGIRYAEFQVRCFSSGTMAMTIDEAILPLDLLSFTAAAIGNKTDIRWHTVNEENVSHFEIQRSTDGMTWEVFSIKTALNGIEQYYNIWDEQPLSGTNYYRLKMIDLDGTYKYSKIVEVSFGQDIQAGPHYLIYPNPNNGTFHVLAQGLSSRETQMFLFDGLGRLVQNQLLQNGDNLIQIKGLAGGMYYLKIENEAGSSSYKVVIE